jgi:hypothetical protein
MPRIIDDDLFERVQARRGAGGRKPRRRGISSEVEFLLTGKAFCGHCKGTMRGTSGTGKSGNKFYYYACHDKIFKHTKCKKRNVGKDWLEREIVRITAEHILTDSVIDFIADKVVALQTAEQADKSMLHYYEQQYKDTCAALDNLMKAIEAGIITDTTKARLLELEQQKAVLETDIEKEKVSLPPLDKLQVVYFLEKFKGGDIDDKQYQRDIIDLFINSVYIYDDRLTVLYNVSGEHREISADIVEKAASDAVNDVFDLMHVKSTICTKVEHSYYFIVGGLFGITTKPSR